MSRKHLLALPVILALLTATFAAPTVSRGQSEAIEYTLRMSNPASHLFEVTISARTTRSGPIDFQMPAWSPGRYVIFDFARNVQDVSATGASGRQLPVVKTDKQTWRVTPTEDGRVVLQYRVFADDLSGTFSQLDDRHGNYNGASIFMYVVGRKANRVRLRIEPPSGWVVVNGAAREPGQILYDLPSYDVLIDTPTEIAPDLDIRSFALDGRQYRVAAHQLGDRSRVDRYAADVQKIVRTEVGIMGVPDFERYTFLVHFDPDAEFGDGMEHLTSTQIIRTFDLGEDKRYDSLLNVTAHEFFHVWNVKRLRPVELGPWDYTRENYTTSLWIAEGITSYYADLTLARAGLWNEERFFDSFAEQITALQNTPGRAKMSVEQSSLDTWLYVATRARQRTNANDVSVNYYNKGQIVGTLLDLEIRHRTANRRSLDDVLRLLYRRFYLDAPQATYYLKGRGYRASDFLSAVNEVSGSDFGEFFGRFVSGTAELDYATALGYAGLKLEHEGRGVDGGVFEVEERHDATEAQRAFRRAWLAGDGRQRAGL